MKEILLIRHAESAANVQLDIIGGRANHVELTKEGIGQAKRVGQYLGKQGIIPQVVYRSPAVRTMQTADYALGEADIHADVYIRDDLQEMSQGGYEGRNRHEVYTPEFIAEMNRIGKAAKLPDEHAESMSEVGDRMYAAAGEMFATLEDEQLALVFGHGLAIRCLASHIENWSREKTFNTKTDNTSLTSIQSDGVTMRVAYIGAMPHVQEIESVV